MHEIDVRIQNSYNYTLLWHTLSSNEQGNGGLDQLRQQSVSAGGQK